MTAFALFYQPERAMEILLGLYASEDDLKEDVKILESIDKLAKSLHNKDVHPQHKEDFVLYSWREIEIAPLKKKGE